MVKLFSKKLKDKKTGVKIDRDKLYDYSSVETREATIRFLFSYAKTGRASWEEYWKLMERYYDGEHDTSKQMAAFVQDSGLPWMPTQCTDGYIHVETQIDPLIPEFEFGGRDDDLDSVKAKQRENVVRFVLDNNDMELMNTRNERRLNKYGMASWKVAWDMSIVKPNIIGDIKIGNPKMTNLFFIPAEVESIDDCEAVAFPYRMHKMAAKRMFAKDLKRIGKSIDDFALGYGLEDTEFMRNNIDSFTYENYDETVQIMEWWFRQPEDGNATITMYDEKLEKDVSIKYEWKAGDIACVILINEEEVRYIPKYWRKTNCDMYPLGPYCKVPNDDYIWGKSEIEPIKDLMDAEDRQLAYAQLNDAFNANDIAVVEEGTMADETEPINAPGQLWKVKKGQLNGVKRLGGITHNSLYDSADKFKQKMQETNGNFDAFQGNEPTRVTTATGIAILNDRSRSRQDIKKVDRKAGFARLYKLIDYTALENYDDNRMIFIGAKSKKDSPISFQYNSDNQRVFDDYSGDYYYPTVDVKIHMGDGLKNSKAFTIQALQELSKTPITPTNYKIIQAYIETIDIPQKVELNEFIDKVATQQTQPPPTGGNNVSIQDLVDNLTDEEKEIIDQNPEIMAKAAEENGVVLK